MEQIQKGIQNPSQQQSSNLKDLKEQFNTEKNHVIPITRVVHLKYKSCCGCGCDTINVERTVPDDSPLQNGDWINDIEKGDKY